MVKSRRGSMKAPVPAGDLVAGAIRENIAIKEKLLEDAAFLKTVSQAAAEITGALKRGRKVLFFGNGGSAADAQHLAAELVGRFERERPGLPAIALTTNTSTVTAVANDYSFEMIFARQLEALGAPGDVAVGISTSGKSPNVLAALRMAKDKKMVTVGMTGKNGGAMRELADLCIRVPSERTARIQEVHILVGHVFCEIVDQSLVR
jgi:D-sedoheptulose 7-phosphate isomerase